VGGLGDLAVVDLLEGVEVYIKCIVAVDLAGYRYLLVV
jgi:hypothetical protein